MKAAARKHSAATAGGSMAYVDEGTGPAVLLLHGLPLSSYLWRSMIPSLSARMRVIAPDLIGAGDSAKGIDAPLDPISQAGYVGELVSALGVESAAVVGHGSGGAVAQSLALDGLEVAALVLIDSPALGRSPTAPGGELRRPSDASGRPQAVRVEVEAIIERGMRHRERLSDADVSEYVRPFADGDGEPAYARAALASNLGPADGDVDSAERLGRLDVPVLLLWGEDDPFVGVATAERLQDAIPTATLALLPGCSHLLPEEAPETVNALVSEWLRARYLGLGHDHGRSDSPILVSLGRRPPLEHEFLGEFLDDDAEDNGDAEDDDEDEP